MYSALRIRGCEAAVKRPEYIGTTWSFRDAMYTIFVYFRILRGKRRKGREGYSHHGPTHYPKPAHNSSILDFPYSTNFHQRSHRQNKKRKVRTNLKLKQLPRSDTLKILQIRSHKGARAKVPQRSKMNTAQGKDTHSLVFPCRIMHECV